MHNMRKVFGTYSTEKYSDINDSDREKIELSVGDALINLALAQTTLSLLNDDAREYIDSRYQDGSLEMREMFHAIDAVQQAQTRYEELESESLQTVNGATKRIKSEKHGQKKQRGRGVNGIFRIGKFSVAVE